MAKTKSTKSVLNSYQKQYQSAMKKERKRAGLPVNRKPYYWEKNMPKSTYKPTKSKAVSTSLYTNTMKNVKRENAKKEEEQTSNTNNGCYIATCIYGSYDCPEVWTLRRFRDTVLDSTYLGRLFIKCYYFFSPTLVKLFGDQKWFQIFWKKRLDNWVSQLNARGIECTKYTDKY